MPIYTTRYSLPSPVGTESNNPPADIRALAVAVEGRLGAIEDAFVGGSSTPAAYSNIGGSLVAWNTAGAYTAGHLSTAEKSVDFSACVDPIGNGPAFGPGGASPVQTYVLLPVNPLVAQVGQDIGGYTYVNDVGTPLAAGRVAWSGISGRGILVAPSGSGFALLTTSNRWRLTYSLRYPVA